jgi:hypothetical protein
VYLPENNENKISQEIFSYPLSIKGFSSEVKNDNGTVISKIKADTIKIKPRKFFVFRIKSLNEALLRNVKLDLFMYEKINGKESILTGQLFDTLNTFITEQTGLGLVSRIILENIDINIHNSDVVTLKLKAKSAKVLKNKNIVFNNAILENSMSTTLIKTKIIIWNSQEDVCNIPNQYLAVSAKGRAKGKGIKVDLNFNIYPL